MRILILAPWCVALPFHGGQIRASQIVANYRRAGYEVMFVGAYDPNSAEPGTFTEDDHPITRAILERISQTPGTPNMAFWHGLADEPASFARYLGIVAKFQPDIIQFEEPFFWPLLCRLGQAGALQRATDHVRILHSSYNIEHAWRRENPIDTTPQEAAFVLELETLEREIANGADAIATVSETDAAAFKDMGARTVFVAPNGMQFPTPTPSAVRAVRQYLDRTPFALFVSSAHPPNASGFLNMVRGAPGARLRNGVVVACGTVGQSAGAVYTRAFDAAPVSRRAPVWPRR